MWMESIVSAEFSENNRQPDDRLIVKSAGRVIFILTSEIDWIEADANYVRTSADQQDGSAARQFPVHPNSSLLHRKCRANSRAAALQQRRIHRVATRRQRTAMQPHLSAVRAGVI